MKTILESINEIANTRLYFAQLVAGLPVDDLNFIPQRINNNIAWHLGHILSVQQSLCYALSGLPFTIPEKIVARYARSTRPQTFIGSGAIELLMYNVSFTLEALKKDIDQDVFKTYQHYITLTGTVLKSMEDAIAFDSFHEQLHFRKASAIQSLLQ